MGLSTSELYLVLRARDEASRVLRNFSNNVVGMSKAQKEAAAASMVVFQRGAALATIGVGVAVGGIVGLMALNKMTDAAIEYNQQAALTLTQVDKAGVSFTQLKQIGIDVGRTVPVAFEQIQPALYDIFSSIDTNAPGAAILLRAIGKAAVAGATDTSVAGRAIIAILNAYKMKATETNVVSDIMFQLVRKGVGTYTQFTSVIGRAIPSAIKAGQSFQSLAGMMAFLTRNGMTAAMASTSAARALDALSKPKSIENLKKMGIAVADAHGKFRPMVDIMQDLKAKLSGLTPVARAVKLNDIFKGSGGTIQAMRFFNLAISDSNKLLPQMTKAMYDSKGAAEQAYKTMANTPQAQIQLMNNKYKAMQIVLGEQLIPAKLALIQALSKVLDWFTKLSPTTQKFIMYGALLTATLMVLSGIVLIIVGAFLMLSAASAMITGGLMAILGPVALVIAAIVAIAVAVYFIIKYWDTIKAFTIAIWNDIVNWLVGAWNSITNAVSTGMDNVRGWIETGMAAVSSVWNTVWGAITGFVSGVWNAIIGFITAGMNWINNIITTALNFILGFWRGVWDLFGPLVMAVWNFIAAVINLGFQVVMAIFRGASLFIRTIWGDVWGWVSSFVSTVWGWITARVSTGFNFMRNIITTGLNFVRDIWSTIWNWVASFVSGVWNRIVGYVSGPLTTIRTNISGAWDWIKTTTGTAWTAVSTAVSTGVNNMMKWITGIRDRVTGALSNIGTWLWDAGANLIRGLIGGISSMINGVTDKISALAAKVKSFFPGSPIKTGPLRSWNNGGAGKRLIGLLADGLNKTGPIDDAMARLTSSMQAQIAVGGYTTSQGASPAGIVNSLGGAPVGITSGQTFDQKFYITTQEIDPRKHAADLGWEFASKVRA